MKETALSPVVIRFQICIFDILNTADPFTTHQVGQL